MAIVNISGTINSSFGTSGVLVNAAQAAGDAVFTIDLRPTNPIIIVQDNLNYGVLGWDIADAVAVITLIGPQGEIYKNEDFNAPDIVPDTSRYLNKTITLPLDPLTDYTNILKGNYTLKISWYNSTLDEYYNFLEVYQYNFDPPTIANTTTSGPYTGVLTSTDTTEYGNNLHQIIREHRIQYPTQLAVPPADVVSSNAQVQVTPIYTNEWTILINSFVEYRNPDTLRIYWEGSGEFTHCVYGGCIGAMYDAVETMLTYYREAMACNLNEQEAYQKRLVIVNTAWHLLNEAYWSGDAEEADQQAYIIQEQVEYTGAGVCGGATSELVTPCPPWTGGGVGGTYTFSNALVEAAGNVTWGGTLVQATTVLMVGYEVLFSGSDAGNTVSQSVSASGGILQKSSDGATEGRMYVTQDLVTLERADIGTPANTRGYELTATGIIEKADYTTGYVDRQLVAKDYVDGLFGSISPNTFENALVESGGVVKWGGALTGHVFISDDGSHSVALGTAVGKLDDFYVYTEGSINLEFDTQGHFGGSAGTTYMELSINDFGKRFIIRDTSMLIVDSDDSKGLENNDDYSAQWTDHSLVTKKWVEDNYTPISGSGTFVALTDVPNDYTGFGGYFVRVNIAADALEFVVAAFVPATGGTFTGQVTISTSTDQPLILRQIGAGSTPGTPEAGINRIAFQDNDSDEQGYIGIDGSGNVALKTWVTGGVIIADGDLTVSGDITPTGDLYIDNIYERSVNNGVIVDGVVLKDSEMSLDYLGDPTVNNVINMNTSTLTWRFSNPAGGIFTEWIGAASGHLFELSQNTGNPSVGTHLLHITASHANVVMTHWNHDIAATRIVYSSVTGDTAGVGRWQMNTNGLIEWGDGTSAVDTNLYRDSADVLKTDDSFIVGAILYTDTITEATGAAGVTMTDELYLTGITNDTDTSVLYYDSATGEVKYGIFPSVNYIPFGSKQSSVDAGTSGETSIDDDYLYVCVTTGGAGSAGWKRVALSAI